MKNFFEAIMNLIKKIPIDRGDDSEDPTVTCNIDGTLMTGTMDIKGDLYGVTE